MTNATPNTTARPTTAAKLRGLADRLDRDAADKYRERRANTPKQVMEATAARIDGDHLKRAAAALRALADAHEAGAVPPALAGVKTKARVLDLTRNKIDHSGGYYSLVDTGELSDRGPEAAALRELAEGKVDPAAKAERDRLNRIAELESRVKFATIPGFFPTPPDLVRKLVELAAVDPGHACLEPSAGKGDIADALRAAGGKVTTCELNPTPAHILALKGFPVLQGCFIARFAASDLAGQFDRIVMNPPFEQMQDVDHVRHAYTFLKPGGRLVAIMSPGPFFRQDRKAVDFRDWLDRVGFARYDAEDGAFKNAFRSTGVKCCIVVIEK